MEASGVSSRTLNKADKDKDVGERGRRIGTILAHVARAAGAAVTTSRLRSLDPLEPTTGEEIIMDIQLSDVLIHIDESLTAERRASVETQLRAIDGVVSVHNPDDKPHLTLVEYRPDKVDSQTLLERVKGEGVHAELVGL